MSFSLFLLAKVIFWSLIVGTDSIASSLRVDASWGIRERVVEPTFGTTVGDLSTLIEQAGVGELDAEERALLSDLLLNIDVRVSDVIFDAEAGGECALSERDERDLALTDA